VNFYFHRSSIIVLSTKVLDNNTLSVTFTSTGFSYLVLLESETVGEFDEMMFSMITGEERTAVFTGIDEIGEMDFTASCYNCRFTN